MPDPLLAESTHTAAAPGAPAAPTGLRVTMLPGERPRLDWDAAPGVQSWDVLDVLNTETPLKDTVTVPSSIRTELKPGSHRRYAVQARNAAGVSPLGNTVDVPVVGPPHPLEPPHPAGPTSVPADVLNLSRWYLTLPVPEHPKDTTPWDVYQTELKTFSLAGLFETKAGPCVEYTAPTDGVTTSSDSGATRCELREMNGPSQHDKADWSFGDGRKHTLTCTLTCDGTSIDGRREVIVGQIHGRSKKPLVDLCVNHKDGGKLQVFRSGPQEGPDLLPGLKPGELFTYRIDVSDGKLSVWVARGHVDELPATPQIRLSASELAETTELFFKAGAYNKQLLNHSPGGAIVRHYRLDLV